MNIKDWAGTIVAIGAAGSLIGTVAYKTGWVVGESQAEEIAQEKANEVHKELLVVQQQLYVSQKEDDKDQLEASIEILKLQIEGMESKPEEERSDYENVMLRIWAKQLEEDVALLVKLNEPEPAP
jgi:hypothetical protein